MSTTVHTDAVLKQFADQLAKDEERDVMDLMSMVVISYTKHLARQGLGPEKVQTHIDQVWTEVTRFLIATKRANGKPWL